MEILTSFGYGAIFWGAFKGIIIGLVLGLVVALLCGKIGLFRRDNKAHQLLVRLFYLYLPLAVAAIIGAWMSVSAIRDEVRSTVEMGRATVTGYSIKIANSALDEVLTDEDSESVSMAGLTEILRNSVDRAVGEQLGKAPAGIQSILGPVRGTISYIISDALGKRLFKQAGKGMNMSMSDAEAVKAWDKGIIQALREGMVMDIIQDQINNQFKTLYNKVIMLAALLLLPVLLEITVSKYLSRRRKAVS